MVSNSSAKNRFLVICDCSDDKRAIQFLSGRSQNCILICSLKVVAIKLLFHPLACRWCSEQIPKCVDPSVHLHCPFPLVLVQADIWPPSALLPQNLLCLWLVRVLSSNKYLSLEDNVTSFGFIRLQIKSSTLKQIQKAVAPVIGAADFDFLVSGWSHCVHSQFNGSALFGCPSDNEVSNCYLCLSVV